LKSAIFPAQNLDQLFNTIGINTVIDEIKIDDLGKLFLFYLKWLITSQNITLWHSVSYTEYFK